MAAIFLAPAGLAAQGLPEGAGRAILEARCTTCHNLDLVAAKRGTEAEWGAILTRMQGYGAMLPADDAPVLREYLLANFGPAAPAADAPTVAAANDNYTVDTDWAQLPAGMTWDASTTSVAANGEGEVVVLVRTAPYFRVFTRDGAFVRAWGDAGLFDEAHSIMFDDAGFIWATDSVGHVVHKFDPDGTLLMTLGSRGMAGDNTSRELFNRPNDVAIAPNGDIFVSDGYTNARVVQFSAEGEFIRIIGGVQGAEAGQLNLPHGVAVDSRGRIIVGDSANQRVSVFGPEGDFIETWNVRSRGGMLITADDRVYVTDVDANAVHIVKDGEIVEVIGGLGRIHGVSLDRDGTIYGSDSLNRTVMKITPR